MAAAHAGPDYEDEDGYDCDHGCSYDYDCDHDHDHDHD